MTLAELRQWFAERYPDRHWNGLCQAVAVNAADATGGWDHTYPTATAAWADSEISSFDPTGAPAGAVHYWDIPNPHGHVAVDLLGDGIALLHGAPADLIGDAWGINLGVAGFDHIAAARPDWKYRGWSLTNGTNRITITKTGIAGDIQEDIMTPEQEKKLLDAIRREARGWRLFRNTDLPATDPAAFVAINYELTLDDPRRIIYLDEQAAGSLRQNYLMLADTIDNAQRLNAAGIATAIRLADGTDRLYKEPTS